MPPLASLQRLLVPLHKCLFARGAGIAAVGMLALVLAACAASPPEAVRTTPTIQEPTEAKYYPSDEPLHMGREQFGRGNYGIAERYFRDAVEKAPKDATAWIGLAACYDRLRRFDLADRAYAEAIKLTGETIQLLNNQGYSFMLRGDLDRTRRSFMRAYQLDPTNPVVLNNLQLLDGSRRFIERTPDSIGSN